MLARVLLDAPLRADMVGDNGGRGVAAERDTTDAAGFCEAPLSAILGLGTVGARSLPFRVGVTVAFAATGASEAAELVRERDRGQGMIAGPQPEMRLQKCRDEAAVAVVRRQRQKQTGEAERVVTRR